MKPRDAVRDETAYQEAFARAQDRATATGKRHEVWRHDGVWGRPGGDVPGHGGYRLRKVEPGQPCDLDDDPAWVFLGFADPEAGDAAQG